MVRMLLRRPQATRRRALVLAVAIVFSMGCDVTAKRLVDGAEDRGRGLGLRSGRRPRRRSPPSSPRASRARPCCATVTIGESTKKQPHHLVLAADPPVATLEDARKEPPA